jgi:N-acyl-D-amino-acid deacylase
MAPLLDRRRLLRRAGAALAGLYGAQAAGAAEVAVSGDAGPGLASFDRLMTAFVALHEVPGAALAVTRGGRLVYARGFGLADVTAATPVQPRSLFRIASASKPITAVAVLRLVERGKLRLEDRALDLLNVKPHLDWWKKAVFDARLRDVTVLQLLHHTGGWDRDRSGDPMTRPVEIARALRVEAPATAEQVIRHTLGKPLDFAPGLRSAYSNFGYCLLGRVIEAASGQPYEAHVRQEVLAPLGIRSMRLGHSLPSWRAAGEVRYYDPWDRTGPSVFAPDVGRKVPLPYGTFHLEAMDAHGGWLASAVDLARFAAAFDDPARCRLLGEKSVRTMFARPGGAAGFEADGQPRAAYYACGWNVRPEGDVGKANHWHGGMLSGTASWLVRRADGLTWAALFNTDAGAVGDYLGGAIDPYLHRAADKVKAWPEVDLFEKYLKG